MAKLYELLVNVHNRFLGVAGFAMETVLSVEAVRIPGAQLVNVHAENVLQIIADAISRESQIPCHIAQLLCHLSLVQLMTLEEMLFHQIQTLARLTAQAEDAI